MIMMYLSTYTWLIRVLYDYGNVKVATWIIVAIAGLGRGSGAVGKHLGRLLYTCVYVTLNVITSTASALLNCALLIRILEHAHSKA